MVVEEPLISAICMVLPQLSSEEYQTNLTLHVAGVELRLQCIDAINRLSSHCKALLSALE